MHCTSLMQVHSWLVGLALVHGDYLNVELIVAERCHKIYCVTRSYAVFNMSTCRSLLAVRAYWHNRVRSTQPLSPRRRARRCCNHCNVLRARLHFRSGLCATFSALNALSAVLALISLKVNCIMQLQFDRCRFKIRFYMHPRCK